MAGIFGEFYLVSVSPRNEARKVFEKFGENSEQNSGQNSGRKFEKFGKLSFGNFSDLRNSCKGGPLSLQNNAVFCKKNAVSQGAHGRELQEGFRAQESRTLDNFHKTSLGAQRLKKINLA